MNLVSSVHFNLFNQTIILEESKITNTEFFASNVDL